ncbi:hypothetical protein F4678DRAFT_331334 [Xylaria arbuscula]|nr:hypothetical protein F4678DRAFT_331334 [Xylaria arbuscula]
MDPTDCPEGRVQQIAERLVPLVISCTALALARSLPIWTSSQRARTVRRPVQAVTSPLSSPAASEDSPRPHSHTRTHSPLPSYSISPNAPFISLPLSLIQGSSLFSSRIVDKNYFHYFHLLSATLPSSSPHSSPIVNKASSGATQRPSPVTDRLPRDKPLHNPSNDHLRPPETYQRHRFPWQLPIVAQSIRSRVDRRTATSFD